MEDVEVTLADQIQKVAKANFAMAWNEATNFFELEDTYVLSTVKSLEEAVNSIISFLGMGVADKSDKVQEGKSSHTLYLAGMLSPFILVKQFARLCDRFCLTWFFYFQVYLEAVNKFW